MFTGLIETVGTLQAISGYSPKRLVIASSLPTDEINMGDSIAIDGVCLTVVSNNGQGIGFDASEESLLRTSLGKLRPHDQVHLERALQTNSRLHGHFVSGHVDELGKVVVREEHNQTLRLGIHISRDLLTMTAPRGSIAVAGVSLTITNITDQAFFVCLVPHTLSQTHLGKLRVNQQVNVEADMLARYVARQLETLKSKDSSLTVELLKDKGF